MLWEDPEPEVPAFLEVAADNTSSVLEPFLKAKSASEFLRDEEVVCPLSAACCDGEMASLDFTFDIDGIVLEVRELSALNTGVNFLTMKWPPVVVPHYHFIKKHIDSAGLSGKEKRMLKHVHGTYIAITDGGFFMNLTVMPSNVVTDDFRSDAHYGAVQARAIMERVFLSFKERVKALGPKDKGRATVRKNNLSDFSKWDVLPQDQRFLLGILDEAIAGETENQDFQILKTLTRFGQKSEEPWYCQVMATREAVEAVSIHAGLTISSADEGTHLMWSRGGLQELVGQRGQLFSCMSMFQAANFSSSLDGLAADWSTEVSSVLKAPNVLFLQMYTDSPHRKLSRAFRHPVSGCIAVCGHMQQVTAKKMVQRARDYLAHMGDLEEKLVGQMSMRMEQVCKFRAGVEGVPASLEPQSLFGMEELRCLLRTRPLVVPFKDTADGSGVMTALRAVTRHYVVELTGLMRNSNGLGGFLSTWSAYQAELALEEVFWGHPLCQEDSLFRQPGDREH